MINHRLKIYLASSFLNKKAAYKLKKRLEDDGFAITSTWTSYRTTNDLAELSHQAIKDLEELMEADIVVVLWPGRFGTNAEIGAALALNKPVYMIGKVPLKRSVYFNHPMVFHFPSEWHLREALWFKRTTRERSAHHGNPVHRRRSISKMEQAWPDSSA